MFIDSHAHLDSSDFHSDWEEMLARASQARVTSILTIGCVGEKRRVLSRTIKLVEEHENIFAALGVHPHDARFFSKDLAEEILQYMGHHKVLGWGEIGLDFHYENSSRDQQREAFRQQLRLARAANNPVIIHSRGAEEETCQILEEEFADLDRPAGVLHCFTSSLETAQRCLQLGFYISWGGIITFSKSEELRKVARQLPFDRLLIETDSPYLAPVPFRGRRNEPAFVVKVAEKLAEVRETSLEDVATTTSANFNRLFKR